MRWWHCRYRPSVRFRCCRVVAAASSRSRCCRKTENHTKPLKNIVCTHSMYNLTVFLAAPSRSRRSFSSRNFFCSAARFWSVSSLDLAKFSNLARKLDGFAPPVSDNFTMTQVYQQQSSLSNTNQYRAWSWCSWFRFYLGSLGNPQPTCPCDPFEYRTFHQSPIIAIRIY